MSNLVKWVMDYQVMADQMALNHYRQMLALSGVRTDSKGNIVGTVWPK